MGVFEKYLSVWVALSILTGILLGYALPGLFRVVSELEFQSVNPVSYTHLRAHET